MISDLLSRVGYDPRMCTPAQTSERQRGLTDRVSPHARPAFRCLSGFAPALPPPSYLSCPGPTRRPGSLASPRR